MRVKTDYDGCKYITAGREYEVVQVIEEGFLAILDDFGFRTEIIADNNPRCHHLNSEGEWWICYG